MKYTILPAYAIRILPLLTLFCFICVSVITAQPKLSFTPIAENMTKPLEIRNAGDGSNRLFIVEQTGRVAIYRDGSLSRRPFLDISSLIVQGPLQGLWSLAFAPDYATSRIFFVYYIDTAGNTTIARYRTSNNPDLADPNSGVILFSWSGRNTGGPKFGQLQFGPDGYLYISVSDGSFYDATTTFAQLGQFVYGKMLRIDIRVPNAPYYSIPPDNPFVNDPNVLDEIWAFGLRNAWRWCFDIETKTMLLADDGNNEWEELNIVTPALSRGANFGWPCFEGNDPFDTTGCGRPPRYTFPVFLYPHDNITGGFATIGGYVYRGTKYSVLKGRYIFSDYLSSNAWIVTPMARGQVNAVLQSAIPSGIAGYGQGEDGELYAASLEGTVYSVGIVNSPPVFSFYQPQNGETGPVNK
jgi:glucose/arabinose dehydrogenase